MGSGEPGEAWSSLLLLERFRTGDERAAEAIVARTFGRLVALARGRLAPRVARRIDPEDVVLSAYRSFFVGARDGRFALSRAGDLWRLLASIAKHKLLRQVRFQGAGRRSVGRETPLDRAAMASAAAPSPSDAAALADELEWASARLGPIARRVLDLRLDGATIPEIAADTGRSERSVRRSLASARDLLAGRLDSGFRGPGRPRVGTGEGPPSREEAESLVGAPLLSHRDYLLRRMIGAGRMGKVYEATHHGTGRAVAVKFLRKSLLSHPRVVRRFLGEARTVARLDHPNIVAAHGLGRTPGGAYFLILERVDGPDLARVAAARAIAVGEAVRWTMQACDALAHAHERGVVHCHLKPANLLLDADGTIRVTDFGLARSTAEDPTRAEVEGTAPFMAPEQVDGRRGPIDARSDVYGVGAVLYALLTGRPPFPGRRLADILAAVVGPDPAPAPSRFRDDLPGSVDEVCRACLAKAPGDRYPSMREVRSALERIADEIL